MPGYGTSPFQSVAQVAAAAGALRSDNTAIPAGNTVTTTSETAFATKFSLAAGALVPGAILRLMQFGLYTSTGVTPTITPRIRLGGVLLLPARAIMGLIGTANSAWQADAQFLVTSVGIVGSGILTIDDNQVRIFGGPAVTGIDLSQPLDLTSSAQWSASGNTITCQGWMAEVLKPTA